MTGIKNETIHELVVEVSSNNIGDIDVLKGLLCNIGIPENEIIECERWPYTSLSVFYKSQAKAMILRKQLRAFRLNGVSVAIKGLRKKDWKTKWKQKFKPFALTRSFKVVPAAYRHRHRSRGKAPIFIDTELTFGTGLHATTRFMAQFIEECKGRFQSFLDIGTGTGILSIIAEKCGAEDIKAIDVSQDAVKVARQNSFENKCGCIDVRKADVQKYSLKKQYDFVAANIITKELIRMADKIIGFVRPGKYLAVSGISINNYAFFRKVYNRYPLKCVRIHKGQGWVGVLYKKLHQKN
ncbi:MAG: 50S ribosomal protein L11 methyltransferase [Candidatus Omnitrophica bacterium]|nr:50S ribosomal protein L11 methyltransferase [Candidatus Omnitrophota bacterium]